jgi:hypothetical protein
MLDRYRDGGGSVREVVLQGCGHGPRSSAPASSASTCWLTSRAQPEPLAAPAVCAPSAMKAPLVAGPLVGQALLLQVLCYTRW